MIISPCARLCAGCREAAATVVEVRKVGKDQTTGGGLGDKEKEAGFAREPCQGLERAQVWSVR